jgi:hypothetical protein
MASTSGAANAPALDCEKAVARMVGDPHADHAPASIERQPVPERGT